MLVLVFGGGQLPFVAWPSGQQALPAGHIAARLMASALENSWFSKHHSGVARRVASRNSALHFRRHARGPRKAGIQDVRRTPIWLRLMGTPAGENQ